MQALLQKKRAVTFAVDMSWSDVSSAAGGDSGCSVHMSCQMLSARGRNALRSSRRMPLLSGRRMRTRQVTAT